MFPKRSCKPRRHRYEAQSSALRSVDVSAPFRTLHAKLSFRQINVAPFESDDFPATQPSVTAEQHDHIRCRSEGLRRFDESLVFIKIVEAHRVLLDLNESNGA